MAEIIVRSIIQALREAYQAFMKGDIEEYEEKLEEARVLLYAMKEEHIDGEEESKTIRIMAWEQEYRLVSSLVELKNLPKLIKIYKEIHRKMFLGKSQIITKDDPFLPPGKDVYAFYNNSVKDEDEWTAELLRDALEKYSALTGGGGEGYEQMYRASAAFNNEGYERAGIYAVQVLNTGNPWLKESAERVIDKISMRKKEMRQWEKR